MACDHKGAVSSQDVEDWPAYLGSKGSNQYAVDGKQYVVIAAGGGKMGTPSGDYYLAFALLEE